MPANEITIYDLQDLERPFVPSRSRLYHLEPIGLGTPYVESLTSYINRLARAHCVRPRKMIAQEVQPLLRISTAKTVNKGLEESESIAMLNGMTPLVGEWIRVLSQLTGREDLQFLSMLTWTNIADQRGVVRSTRAWCAACYDEWLREGQIIYEPLLWNVKAVTRCPFHHLDLLDRCPQQDCRQSIPLLTGLSSSLHCPNCGSSLTAPAPKVTMNEPFTDKPGGDIQQWNANATAALLSAAPMLSTTPSRDRVAAGITAYISHTISSMDEVLAHKLGIGKAIFMNWQRGLHLPRFNTLLTMCFHMNISPLLFLTDDVESFFLAQPSAQVNSVLKATQKSGPVNIEYLKKDLTKILREDSYSVLSLHAIARKLGYPKSTLRHYFPEQCQAITERYQQRKSADHRQILENFLMSNEHLTLNEIARRLGCPVTTLKYRYPELCRAITGQNQRVLAIGKIHEALLEALRCEGCSFPTVSEISKHFECSPSVLYHHFSELCLKLTKKHKNNRPGVRNSEKTTRDLSISEVGAITDKPKRPRKIFSMEDIDRMHKGLESLLENGAEHPLTMTELANRFECSRHTLRRLFPDLCDKLMKKQEKKEYVNRLRQVLEEVLMDNTSPAPSVDRLARQLGCSSAMLRHHFPDLCKLISQRYMGLTDVEIQRNTLEEVMRSSEEAKFSINEIARRLGCANETLYNRFPEQCKTVVKRRWQAIDINGMQKVLEAALANDEEPPPTLRTLSELLGCPTKNLEYYFPEMCRAITERRRQLLGLARFRPRLEEMLASDDPVSMQEVARRLGCSASSLRKCFPELCTSISARYRAHRRSRSLEIEEQICNEIREIVIDLNARGEYPAQYKVQAFVSKPGHFWRLKVRNAWRDAVRELGLSD